MHFSLSALEQFSAEPRVIIGSPHVELVVPLSDLQLRKPLTTVDHVDEDSLNELASLDLPTLVQVVNHNFSGTSTVLYN